MKFNLHFAIVLSFPATLLVTGVARAQAPTTERVSLAAGGTQGDAGSFAPSISADGRFIAFESPATNLVTGDTNGLSDVFVRDRQSATNERVSVSTGGAQSVNLGSTFGSGAASISADGRFVAFASFATNLVTGDTNGLIDVFVRDRVSGTTERVSVDSAGNQGNGNSAFGDSPTISADGRFVAFLSSASNLVAGDTNGYADVFVRDRQAGTTERVSVATSGAQGNYNCYRSSISADGRYVVIVALASDLVLGDTNGRWDIFVRDRQSGTTERVSVDTSGAQGNGDSYHASISADGRFVAFESVASNLVTGDTNGREDIFVHDRQLGTTECVSVDSFGSQGQGTNSVWSIPSISADGRFVSYGSTDSSLVTGDTNGRVDIFVRDRLSGTTERVSVATGGVQGNHDSEFPSISATGRFVVYDSYAWNLVAGDTNATADVFVRDLGALPVSYCTSSTSSNGCTASIASNLNPSVSHATPCNVTVTSFDGLKSGIVFYGIDNTGFSPTPWAPGSTSLLCVKHPTQRTPIQNSGGTFNACDGSFVLDWNAYQSAHPLALGNPWSAGDKVYMQAWFRDPLAVKATNLSNAVELTYVP